MGLFLFTLRNGRLADLQRGGGMCYAKKLLISREDQLGPMHTHVLKAEDIINRGGATLVIEVFGSDDQGGFAEDRGGRGTRPPPRQRLRRPPFLTRSRTSWCHVSPRCRHTTRLLPKSITPLSPAAECGLASARTNGGKVCAELPIVPNSHRSLAEGPLRGICTAALVASGNVRFGPFADHAHVEA